MRAEKKKVDSWEELGKKPEEGESGVKIREDSLAGAHAHAHTHTKV